jgi:hypothetical protein
METANPKEKSPAGVEKKNGGESNDLELGAVLVTPSVRILRHLQIQTRNISKAMCLKIVVGNCFAPKKQCTHPLKKRRKKTFTNYPCIHQYCENVNLREGLPKRQIKADSVPLR